MPRRTLLQLREAIRERVDMVGSTFVTDAQLTRWINDSTRMVYDELLEAYGGERYCDVARYELAAVTQRDILWPPNPTGFPIVGTVELPQTFYRLLRVDWARGDASVSDNHYRIGGSPDCYHVARPLQLTTQSLSGTPQEWLDGDVRYWAQLGPIAPGGTPATPGSKGRLIFHPLPSSQVVVQVYYVPEATELSSDSDVSAYGYEELVIADVASRCLRKQRSDDSRETQEREIQLGRLRSAKPSHDHGFPRTVRDMSGYPGTARMRWPLAE